MRNTFLSLATEELDVQPAEEKEEEVLTADDNIEKLEESFNQTATDTANEIQSFEDCTNCEDELEGQVEVINTQLENNPEEISDAKVDLVQEAFYNSIRKILSKEEVQSISFESSYLPVERMMLTKEGIMDVIKKIIEKIKFAFQQVGQFFKKLWVKFVVYMDGTAKRAEELYKKYEGKVKGRTISCTAQLQESLLMKIGLPMIAKASPFASQFLPYIKFNATAFDKVTSTENMEGLGVDKTVAKVIKTLQSPDANMSFTIAEEINRQNNLKEKGFSDTINVISMVEDEVKYIYFQLAKGEDGKYDPKKYEDVFYETATIDPTKFKVGTIKFNGLDASKIRDELQIVRNYAKGASVYKDRLLDVQNAANKSLDQIYKHAAKTDSANKTQLKYIQILGSKMILDNIMQYVKTCRYTLWCYEELLKTIEN
jgi:hypothetical protein